MRIHIRDHLDLGMAGITLHRLDVPAVKFQLIRNARMAYAVKNDLRKITLINDILQPVPYLSSCLSHLLLIS